MRNFFAQRSRRFYILSGAILIVVVLVAAVVIFKNGNGDGEHYEVTRRDVVDEVRVSGRVEAGIVSDMGFEVTGSVSSIPVSVGDEVQAGTPIVSLSLGALPSQLASAQAELALKGAEIASTQTSLDAVVEQQDTVVENARRTLNSEGLVARPSIQSVELTPPTISGIYTGPQGQYRLSISSIAFQDRYDMVITGIENLGPVILNKNTNKPTVLGSYGLYISFPEGLSNYKNTTWLVEIPNTKSSVYTENLNAYDKAKTDRTVAIEEAQSTLSNLTTGTSVSEAELNKARAEVSRISAEIARRQIRAPFSGVVSNISVDVGDIVSANEAIVQLISQDDFGVAIDLPEVDSVKVSVGDKTDIKLDAFPDEVFSGEVVSVNRTETLVDDVSVYEARVVFTDKDERVVSGMTAEVSIATDERHNVIAVPARAVQTNNDGQRYVLVEDETGQTEAVVKTGLRGIDGFVEILNGLVAGDIVYIP